MKIQQTVLAILLLQQGIEEAIRNYTGFAVLEKKVFELALGVSRMMLEWVLRDLDDVMLAERDRNLEVVGFREKTLVSLCGEVVMKRRLYKDRKTGESRFLLDEALGMGGRERITPGLKEMLVSLATEVTFRKASEIVSKVSPGVSAMSVWEAAKEVGNGIREGQKALREKVFELGEVPPGERAAEKLHIEADGVFVNAQRGSRKKEEIKCGVVYEGKEQKGDRVGLKERKVVAGCEDGRDFWEETVAKVGSRWDLSKLKKVWIGGDGASWVQAGVEYFDGTEYQLDEFHLKKRLHEALVHDEEGYEAVASAIVSKDLEALKKSLSDAEKRASQRKRKIIKDFRQYVLDNWDGIKTSDEAASLGTIEGQIYHWIARRMKRVGARWSPDGADRMARLLAAKANNELNDYASQPVTKVNKRLTALIDRTKQHISEDLVKHAEDIGAWLRAKVPALCGPYQSTPFVKYVLRKLAYVSSANI